MTDGVPDEGGGEHGVLEGDVDAADSGGWSGQEPLVVVDDVDAGICSISADVGVAEDVEEGGGAVANEAVDGTAADDIQCGRYMDILAAVTKRRAVKRGAITAIESRALFTSLPRRTSASQRVRPSSPDK